MPSRISASDPRVTLELDLNPRQLGFAEGVINVSWLDRVPTPLLFDVTSLGEGAEVLLIRRHGLGDTLMLTPLLRAMAGRGVVVDFQTDPRYVPLLAGNPYIRSAFPVGVAPVPDPYDYDAVLDLDKVLHHPAAEQSNRIQHFARSVGLTLASPAQTHLDYFPTDQEIEDAKLRINALPIPRIAYCWRSRSASRNLGKPTHLRAIRELLRAGASIIVLSENPEEDVPERPEVLNLCGGVKNLRDVAALLASCDGVVTPDTGLFHLASALDKPILAYFGAFDLPDRVSGDPNRVTLANEPSARCCYAPCRQYNCPFADVDRQSPCVTIEHGRIAAWVKKITPDRTDKAEAPAETPPQKVVAPKRQKRQKRQPAYLVNTGP